ncbi:hypothetical protein [Dyella tabacisoli]|uniref:hypothetical protein n=1 Tax=Dyella tabacisoli TaxID=2282381 RepID=UPI0013B36DF0|nr:hypothetical protein [Dyella tabacisoli]
MFEVGLSHEAARMRGAGLIVAMATPAMLSLGGCFPLSGHYRLRHLLTDAGSTRSGGLA